MFLNSVSGVEIDGRVLTLILQNPFYKDWVMEETNRRSIINIITFYTEGPAAIELKIRTEKLDDDGKNVRSKLQNRYKDLME